MHFWIDKRSTGYGRRRPPFYSSGAMPSSSFGRDRRSRTLRSAASSSLASNSSTNRRGSSSDRSTPRHYHYATQSRVPTLSPRRPSTSYRSLPDPAIQQALDELDAELRMTFPPPLPSNGRRVFFSTKQIGLCLCFMGFILLCTVAGNFIIKGPAIIDASRRSASTLPASPSLHGGSGEASKSSASFFFAYEVIFVAFALGLFFAGVTCLRKGTNEYLLRQFRQHIINSHQGEVGTDSSRSSGTTLISMSEDDGAGSSGEIEPGMLLFAGEVLGSRSTRNERRPSGYSPDGAIPSGRNRRYYNYAYGCQPQQLLQSIQKPPPYEVALYLPLPNQAMPHHAHNTLTLPSADGEPNDIEKCEDGGADTAAANPSRTETPPPAYELQFSCEI